jgi:hypothetical protein
LLDPRYVTPTNPTTSFDHKKTFIYNVFTQSVTATKGIFLRAYSTTNDAQVEYIDLLTTYDDTLSLSFDSSTLCSELAVMKLDDK